MYSTLITRIEHIYECVNIYRAIILLTNTEDNKITHLYNQLCLHNHNPLIITAEPDINYDYRLFIIKDIDLLDKFSKDSYNLIITDI